jgi:hypothetical protein|tara:strand:+ start:1081 stop:1581 length:501 start_codon:yes stop_codon:yes gene_type:complete
MINIKNNFLEIDIFNQIKKTIFDQGDQPFFPWYLQDYKVNKNDNHVQLTHVFYFKNEINSNYFDVIKPILNKLNIKNLVKIKANVTLKQNEIKPYGYHTDFNKPENEDMNTAIFYFHTTNGPTFFKDNPQVDCIENTMVAFPASLEHTGSTHTNNLFRGVLNINWR